MDIHTLGVRPDEAHGPWFPPQTCQGRGVKAEHLWRSQKELPGQFCQVGEARTEGSQERVGGLQQRAGAD